jgi:hypothetical protein
MSWDGRGRKIGGLRKEGSKRGRKVVKKVGSKKAEEEKEARYYEEKGKVNRKWEG